MYKRQDEKSFLHGQRYISLMTDLKNPRVLEVVEGRDTAQAMALWEALPEDQRSKVEAAAMDMGANFVAATRLAAPQVAIVHDRFHVAKHLNDAVDQTRRQEAARLAEKGDETLKKTRYLWLHGTVPEQHQATFAELLEMNLKTSRAWLYKEQMVEFWGQADAASGERFFAQWYRTVTVSYTHLGQWVDPHQSLCPALLGNRIFRAAPGERQVRTPALPPQGRGTGLSNPPPPL